MTKRHMAIAAAFALAAIPWASDAQSAQTVVVTEQSPGIWFEDSTRPSQVSFVSGTSTAAGSGSARFTVAGAGSDAELRTRQFDGRRLTEISELGFSTFAPSGQMGSKSVYLVIDTDRDGNGMADDSLIYEPSSQSGYAPATGTWRRWNASTGSWRSLAEGQSSTTLSAYAGRYPNAVIRGSNNLGGVRLTAGFGGTEWTNFLGHADLVTIGISGSSVTYDFEPAYGQPGYPSYPGNPVAVPMDKDDCKKGGYSFFGYRNQGQCVSSVANGSVQAQLNSQGYGSYPYGYGGGVTFAPATGFFWNYPQQGYYPNYQQSYNGWAYQPQTSYWGQPAFTTQNQYGGAWNGNGNGNAYGQWKKNSFF